VERRGWVNNIEDGRAVFRAPKNSLKGCGEKPFSLMGFLESCPVGNSSRVFEKKTGK